MNVLIYYATNSMVQSRLQKLEKTVWICQVSLLVFVIISLATQLLSSFEETDNITARSGRYFILEMITSFLVLSGDILQTDHTV